MPQQAVQQLAMTLEPSDMACFRCRRVFGERAGTLLGVSQEGSDDVNRHSLVLKPNLAAMRARGGSD